MLSEFLFCMRCRWPGSPRRNRDKVAERADDILDVDLTVCGRITRVDWLGLVVAATWGWQ